MRKYLTWKHKTWKFLNNLFFLRIQLALMDGPGVTYDLYIKYNFYRQFCALQLAFEFFPLKVYIKTIFQKARFLDSQPAWKASLQVRHVGNISYCEVLYIQSSYVPSCMFSSRNACFSILMVFIPQTIMFFSLFFFSIQIHSHDMLFVSDFFLFSLKN